MLVSSCRYCVLLSRVHPSCRPVVIRSAVFCTACSLFVFMSYIIGDQIVLPYFSVVLVMAVYVLSSVSLNFLQCVVVRALRIFLCSLLCLSYFVCVFRKCV